MQYTPTVDSHKYYKCNMCLLYSDVRVLFVTFRNILPFQARVLTNISDLI